jgi:hypothetical protein
MQIPKNFDICSVFSYVLKQILGKINLAKSGIVLVEAMGDVEELASILGCKVSSLPMKYLGLPLGASYKAISI